MRIICLDIDDAILPSNNTYFGQVDDNFQILELNMKRIQMMINKYNMKVFITASFYSSLILDENGNVKLKNINSINPKSYEVNALNLISKYLDGYVIGLSSGDRFEDIKELLNEGHVVIAIDDMDLSSIEHDNFLFIETHGFITNNLTFKINSFIKVREI